LGLFLMLSKEMKADGSVLHLIGVSSGLRRQFRLNGLEYLLATRTS
jgi:hypothetical protein